MREIRKQCNNMMSEFIAKEICLNYLDDNGVRSEERRGQKVTAIQSAFFKVSSLLASIATGFNVATTASPSSQTR